MKISGRLLGKESGPLNGASVQILDDGGEISKVRSNSQGKFECPVADAFADRPLKLSAQLAGYHNFQSDIRSVSDTDLGDLFLTASVPPTPQPPPAPPMPQTSAPAAVHKSGLRLLYKPEGPLFWKIFDVLVLLLVLYLSNVLFKPTVTDGHTADLNLVRLYEAANLALYYRVIWRLCHPK